MQMLLLGGALPAVIAQDSGVPVHLLASNPSDTMSQSGEQQYDVVELLDFMSPSSTQTNSTEQGTCPAFGYYEWVPPVTSYCLNCEQMQLALQANLPMPHPKLSHERWSPEEET